MVKKFLITRPNHDRITSYLHDFAKGIVKIVKESRDIHVTDLEGVQATREHLEKALKESPKLVFLNGHGDRKSVAGHKNEIVLDENNIYLTKDKIVYALSCNSLERLGQIAVEKADAKAYIGYQARFMLVCDPSRESSPHKDKNALPFKRACFALIT